MHFLHGNNDDVGGFYGILQDVNSNLFRGGSGSEYPKLPADKISYPPPSSSTLPKYPKEKIKTLVAFGLFFVSLVLNSLSIALTHDRMPDGPPLPDVIQFIPAVPQLMTVPDVLVLITLSFCFLTVLLHHHRSDRVKPFDFYSQQKSGKSRR